MSTSHVEILITENVQDGLLDQLRAISPRVRLTVQPRSKADEIAPEIWQRTEVLYTGGLLPPPEQTSNLRWVQFSYAGLDSFTESPTFAREGLQITSLSGAAAAQVAEYAVAMLLALGHRLPQLMNLQSKAEWPKDRWDRLTPSELRGSTVGLVGYGSIGREIARLLQPFHVTILACKRDARQPQDDGYTPDGMGDPMGDLFTRLYPIEAVRSMMRECDFVVVTLPLTEATTDLIGAADLAGMKTSAYLVDVGRGGVINSAALTAALQEKRIAGAALDVFPQEPLPKEDPLWKLPNVIISPHIAGISRRYQERAMALFAENLRRYLSGDPLLNRYDSARGY